MHLRHLKEDIPLSEIRKIFKSANKEEYRRDIITISSKSKTDGESSELEPFYKRRKKRKNKKNEDSPSSLSFEKCPNSQKIRINPEILHFRLNEDIRRKILGEGDNFWDEKEYLKHVENQIFIKNLYNYWSHNDRVLIKEVNLYNLERAKSKTVIFFFFYKIHIFFNRIQIL